MTAIDDIAAERARQIEKEGWTLEHDDSHDEGDLATAATCYAANAACLLNPYNGTPMHDVPTLDATLGVTWPWEHRWWKPALSPEDARRDLVKAGALIVAEIERLDRSCAPIYQGQCIVDAALDCYRDNCCQRPGSNQGGSDQ